MAEDLVTIYDWNQYFFFWNGRRNSEVQCVEASPNVLQATTRRHGYARPHGQLRRRVRYVTRWLSYQCLRTLNFVATYRKKCDRKLSFFFSITAGNRPFPSSSLPCRATVLEMGSKRSVYHNRSLTLILSDRHKITVQVKWWFMALLLSFCRPILCHNGMCRQKQF